METSNYAVYGFEVIVDDRTIGTAMNYAMAKSMFDFYALNKKIMNIHSVIMLNVSEPRYPSYLEA